MLKYTRNSDSSGNAAGLFFQNLAPKSLNIGSYQLQFTKHLVQF